MSTSGNDTPKASRLAEYMSRQIPDAADLTVDKVARNMGGMSRETWFIDTTRQQAGKTISQTFTVRADHPGGAVVPVPLEYEYKVYKALAGSGVPVAKALWYESDSAWIGRPFYIRETIEGSSAPRQLFREGEDELRRSIGRQLAILLARIHTLDWRAFGFDKFMSVPESDEECARLELSRWKDHYEANCVEARPLVMDLFSWLDQHAPSEVPRMSLVWGDVGLGNFIFRDDQVVGLTDWEQAHLGDPMKDWASALFRGVDNLLPREELFEVYEKESGLKVDLERIEYYTAFINANYVAISHPVVKQIIDCDGKIDVSLVRLSLAFPFQCQDNGLRTIGY